MTTAAERARALMDPGDVLARESVLCQHGREGYCHDDALPEERTAVDYIYRSAFEYSGDEGYAAWIVSQCWTPGAFYLTNVSHPRDYEEYRASLAS